MISYLVKETSLDYDQVMNLTLHDMKDILLNVREIANKQFSSMMGADPRKDRR